MKTIFYSCTTLGRLRIRARKTPDIERADVLPASRRPLRPAHHRAPGVSRALVDFAVQMHVEEQQRVSASPDPRPRKCSGTSGLMPPAPPQPPPPPPPAPTPLPSGKSARDFKNVLFIAVDDLRPEIGAYGHSYMHTPHIDAFAKQSTVFTRAYVQYSFCGPSRNSFMTGRRPDATQAWSFMDHFREEGVGDKWISMPQWFRLNGFYTSGAGKLHCMAPVHALARPLY